MSCLPGCSARDIPVVFLSRGVLEWVPTAQTLSWTFWRTLEEVEGHVMALVRRRMAGQQNEEC